jgi:uncharacterized protein YkwD
VRFSETGFAALSFSDTLEMIETMTHGLLELTFAVVCMVGHGESAVRGEIKAPSPIKAPGGLKPPAKPAPPAQPRLHPVEEQVVTRTNAERRRHGLPALRVDGRLMGSARRHTAWMTRSRSLTHTSAGVAENIAMGQSSSGEALSSWMSSSGHRANILNASYRRIGVAAYSTPEGRIFWCQQFLP